jgi:acyl transferase domain-containing protein
MSLAANSSGNDIAIIGLSCVFPAVGDARRYWQNIETNALHAARVSAVGSAS